MNFLQLCQRLRQEVGGSGSGPSTVLSQNGENRQYVDWINQAWIEIQSMHSWHFLWTQGSVELQPGALVHALPDDLGVLDSASMVIGGVRLPLVDYLAFRDAYRAAGVGRPVASTLLPNGQLKLSAYPDQPYTLEFDYFIKPASLASNTEIPALPGQFHMLIVYKAMQFYGTYENAPEVFRDGLMKYERMLPDLENAALPPMSLPGAIA